MRGIFFRIAKNILVVLFISSKKKANHVFLTFSEDPLKGCESMSIHKDQAEVVHRAESRGTFSNSWLTSFHTFSFGDYFEPSRVNFGVLRVLNDDTVAPEGGFATHPHSNMEIVSIPLSGSLSHRDSVGNASVIQTVEVQLMSAGTGITHSEFNPAKTASVNFLQIWILPKIKDIQPRYAQTNYASNLKHAEFTPLVVPLQHTPSTERNAAIEINQDAVFSLGLFNSAAKVHFLQSKELSNANKAQNFGVYFFVIEGSACVHFSGSDIQLGKRDACGIFHAASSRQHLPVTIETTGAARILSIEVPV